MCIFVCVCVHMCGWRGACVCACTCVEGGVHVCVHAHVWREGCMCVRACVYVHLPMMCVYACGVPV